MLVDRVLTGLKPGTFLLAALSLSIGWGIRGNFGHEYGAMIPGALTAIAVCVMSGRKDWRDRVMYFAFFGALGWGFGGSMSYMQVISYTQSGQAMSQYYGFCGLFLIGFLWGALGGAGTAFPAVADRDRLTEIFKPIALVLLAWFIQWRFEEWLENWQTHYDATWKRQEDILYWFDTDWFAAVVALGTMCLYDLWKKSAIGVVYLGLCVLLNTLMGWHTGVVIAETALLFLLALLGERMRAPGLVAGFFVAGAGVGCIVQALLKLTGLSRLVVWLFVWPQADLATLAQTREVAELMPRLMYNWPNFLMAHPGWTGALIGGTIGLVIYFRKWGKFPDSSSLIVYMSVGWLLAFLCMPVLLNFGGAGLRMTPPRGDNWAGLIGVYLGAMLWFRRNGMFPVVYAARIAGIVGGLGFTGAVWLKLMMISLGNPHVAAYAADAAAWKHWQSANWHSFLEQSYGFINGIGVALAIGLLARRTGSVRPGSVPRPWTEVFAIAWVLFGVGWINMQKCVPEFTEGKQIVPDRMQAPLLSWPTLDTYTWFNLLFAAVAIAIIGLMYRHKRRYVAIVPESAVAKGQLFYIVFLWEVVIMNIVHALPGFSDGRLLTEGVISFNAILVTVLILVLPREAAVHGPLVGDINFDKSFGRLRWGMAAALLTACIAMPLSIRARYDGKPVYDGKGELRFGENATWRTSPIIKGEKHR